VLRPGGRLGIFNWMATSGPGRMFRSLAGYMPPPPDFAEPPLRWGDETHVRDLFAGTGIELDFDREFAPNPIDRFDSVDERIDFYTTTFGPLIQMRRFTAAHGTWPALRDELATLYADTDATGEYLVVLGRKRGRHEA
jgi:hypothetical protein